MLQDYVDQLAATTTTQFTLEIEETIAWESISSEIKMNVYRIIQETCYNIKKHAQAKRAVITMIRDENNLCISITDDGIGFDVFKKKEGIGLQNMQQRIQSLKGKFHISSQPKTLNSTTTFTTAITMAIPIL